MCYLTIRSFNSNRKESGMIIYIIQIMIKYFLISTLEGREGGRKKGGRNDNDLMKRGLVDISEIQNERVR